MARLIKTTITQNLFCNIETVFDNGQESTKKHLGINDFVNGLRYVQNGDIYTANGRVSEIEYTVASKLSYNVKSPTNCLTKDVTVNNIIIDESEQYKSNLITVPAIEIVEDDGVENVERIIFGADAELEMEMKYSNNSVVHHIIKIGDVLTQMKIMGAKPGDADITGDYVVDGFAYTRLNTGKLNITGLILSNDSVKPFVANLNNILSFFDLAAFRVDETDEILSAVNDAKSGAVIQVTGDVNIKNNGINIDGKDIVLNLSGSTVSSGSGLDSNIKISNGKLTIDGNGEITTSDPYDSTHSNGVINVNDGGELVFQSGKISAIIEEDTVNKGQFGIIGLGTSNVTINGGEIDAGWYAVSGNGSKTNPDSVITINGGKLLSATDFAIYQPHAGTLIINDGEIVGGAGALSANNGNIIINGGTLRTLGTGDTGNWSDGTSGQNNAAINLNGKYGPVNLEINGGRFISTGEHDLIIAGTKFAVSIAIKGGEFSSKPNSEWIAAGFACSEEKNADGFYVVSKV